VPIPANMSFEEGATMPVAYTTAWSSLFGHHPKLQSGQTVLCLGTGGVSLCAAQVGASHIILSYADDRLPWSLELKSS
jgi:NADPH:quinone reductase-like Zn-dependent oxidoreductase